MITFLGITIKVQSKEKFDERKKMLGVTSL